jgi:hypothetical protein
MTAKSARGWLTNQDVWFVGALVLAALLVSVPLFGGGLALYLDNPSHLAEIHAAAHDAHGGWSDDAWAGFPVGSLHSPLWYAPLVWIERAGLKVDLFYFGAVLLGFLAPALAMYRVARRSVAPPAAGLLALVLLIQRPVILGFGSAFGGMWTFYLATGFFILLVDVLARPAARTPWLPAALTGLIFLSHLFPVVPLLIVAAAALLLSLVGRRLSVGRAAVLTGALALGVLAAVWYWLPMLLVGELTHLDPQTLTPGQIIARLLVPTDVLAMLTGRMLAQSWATALAAVPMILLVLAGLSGAVFLKRRRDDVPVIGLILAGTVMVLLTVVVGNIEIKFLGPVTWRLLYFARIGLALGAIPLLGLLPTMRALRAVFLVPVMLLTAFFSGQPLKRNAPDPASADMADIRGVWSWLASHRQADWGRIHLQDTFQLDPGPNGLGASHVLALTAREAGVRQVGAAYSVAPYLTVPWTASEFSTLFGKFILKPEDVSHVVDKAWFANATHILTSDPRTADLLKSSGAFSSRFVAGRFEILRWQGYAGEWAGRFEDGKPLPGIDFQPGRISIPLGGEDYTQGIMVKTSYHPFWRTEPGSAAKLSPHPSGLMVITNLEPERLTLDIEFRPPVWPKFMSLLAVLGIAAMAWGSRAMKKRADP